MFGTTSSMVPALPQRRLIAGLSMWRLLLLSLVVTGALTTFRGIKAQTLVPAAASIPFSTYYGGSENECAFSPCVTVVDEVGNIYIAGATRSDDFPLVNPFSTGIPGGEELFVVKLIAGTNEVAYSTYVGRGVVYDIAVDGEGNAYVTGWTSDPAFPVTEDALQPERAGGVDAIVVKLSADGSELLYSTFLGGSGRDEGRGIDVDAAGAIYVTGQTDSDDFLVKDALQGELAGRQDVFITKMDADGVLDYSTYLGGGDGDSGWRIVARSDGSALLTGRSGSDDFPTTPGVVQPDRFSNAGNDVILVKVSSAGALEFSTFFNETSTEEGIDLAVDVAGNSYVLTRRQGIVTFNADATAILRRADIDLITDVDSEGGIAVDEDGITYAVGWVGEGIDRNIALVVVNERGIVVYTEEVGGSDGDFGHDVAVVQDGDGRKTAYVVGKTESSDFPTADPLQDALAGASDVAIVIVTDLESVIPTFVYLPLVHVDRQ